MTDMINPGSSQPPNLVVHHSQVPKTGGGLTLRTIPKRLVLFISDFSPSQPELATSHLE